MNALKYFKWKLGFIDEHSFLHSLALLARELKAEIVVSHSHLKVVEGLNSLEFFP